MSLEPTVSVQKFLNYRNLLIFLALLYFVKVLSVGAGDFRAYYHAGTKVTEGLSPYFFYIPEQGWVSMFSYPPFFALFMVIFTILPVAIAGGIWNILNLIALFRIYNLLSFYIGIKEYLTPKQYTHFVFFTLLFTIRFILYNFDLTQSTLIVMWGTLESLRLIKKDEPFGGSLLLASVISIKLLPLVMVPYLLYRSYFKEATMTIFFVLILNCLPILVYGMDDFVKIISEWWKIVNPNNLEFTTKQNAGDETTHGLSAFVPAFFSDSVVRYDLRRHFIVLNDSQISTLLTAFRLFFIALTLYFLKTRPFKKDVSRYQFIWEVSYLLMVIPLIFPQQMKYAFALLLPAVSYILFYLLITKRAFKFYALLSIMSIAWLLTTFSTDGIIGKQLYEYAQYYKLITWGTFLLIFALAQIKPEEMEQVRE
jgi:Glycosyltransferase family 87